MTTKMNKNNTKTTTPTIVVIFMIATLVVGGTFAATTHSAFAYILKKDNKKDKKDGGNDNGNTVINQVSQAKLRGHSNIVKQENVLCTHPANNKSCLSEGSDNPGNNPVTVTVPVTNTNTNDNTASSSSSSEATASNTNDITNTVIVTNGTLPPVGTTSGLKILGLGTVKVTTTTPDSDGNCLKSQLHATSNTGPVCLSIKK